MFFCKKDSNHQDKTIFNKICKKLSLKGNSPDTVYFSNSEGIVVWNFFFKILFKCGKKNGIEMSEKLSLKCNSPIYFYYLKRWYFIQTKKLFVFQMSFWKKACHYHLRAILMKKSKKCQWKDSYYHLLLKKWSELLLSSLLQELLFK